MEYISKEVYFHCPWRPHGGVLNCLQGHYCMSPHDWGPY